MSSRTPATPILWIAGAVLAGQCAAPATAGWALPAAAATAAALTLARSPQSESARLIALAALALAAGHRTLDTRLHPDLPESHIARLASAHVHLSATIEEPPAARPAGLRLVLRAEAVRRGSEWRQASGRVLLTVRRSGRDWLRGDRVALRLRLRAPRNFGNPGEFDYEHYLARRAIYTTGYADSDADWQRLPRSNDPSWVDRVRSRAMATLEQVAPEHLRPVAAALLLGDGSSLPADLRRKYARAGVSHVLAVSGLHIGLVAGGGYAASRWLLSRSEFVLLHANVPKLATAVSLPPVLVYAAIAGPAAATLRATVMAIAFLSALLLDRSRYWTASITAAAAAVSIVSPGAMFEASFQLSFAALIGIVTAGRRLRDAFDRVAERRLLRLRAPRLHAVARWLVLSQCVTIPAILATAPLTLYHFQQLSVVGLLGNLLVVPVTGMAAVSVGLSAVLINPLLPGLGGVLFAACCACLAAGDLMVAWLAEFPGADVRVPTPRGTDIAAYYALLAAAILRPSPGRRALLLATSLIVAVQAAAWWVERHGDELRVTFISVGQGDCTLVEFPGGDTMLVDGGGLSATFDVGERVIAPFLLRRKILRLDIVVVTHPDFDHYGGLPHLIEHFRPKEIWTNGSHGRGRRYEDFHERVTTSGASLHVVERGYEREIGGANVRVIHPPLAPARPVNDDSVVLRVEFGPTSFLLTGDVERGGEARMVGRGDLPSTVLLVPHHGSRTSSSPLLLDTAQPAIAVVSSGFGNRYNLPHPSIVERYTNRGIELLGTAHDGAIEFRMVADGRGTLSYGRRWRRQRSLSTGAANSLNQLPFLESANPFRPAAPST